MTDWEAKYRRLERDGTVERKRIERKDLWKVVV